MAVSVDELVQFVQEHCMDDADVSGECDVHGEQNLVRMGEEPVCRDCLSEFIHSTLLELDGRFHIFAGAEE